MLERNMQLLSGKLSTFSMCALLLARFGGCLIRKVSVCFVSAAGSLIIIPDISDAMCLQSCLRYVQGYVLLLGPSLAGNM